MIKSNVNADIDPIETSADGCASASQKDDTGTAPHSPPEITRYTEAIEFLSARVTALEDQVGELQQHIEEILNARSARRTE